MCTSYFVTTCVSVEVLECECEYLANFEDDFGNAARKEINRPSIYHFPCEILLIMHEHNRMRQNIMALERK